MIRFRRISVLLVLILASGRQARASIAPDLAACEEQLTRSADGESPAQCLFDLATKSGPSREAAARRLEGLARERPEDLWFAINLGSLKRQTRDKEQVLEAERLYRQSIERAHQRGLPRAEFAARQGICRILRDAGLLEEEAAEMELALQLADSSRDPLLRTRAKLLQAAHWKAKGEFDTAYRALRGIRGAVEAADSYPLTREYFFALGLAAQQTGRFKEAHDAYRRFVEIATRAGDFQWAFQASYGMATIRLEELRDMPSAGAKKEMLDLAHASLAAARATGNPSMETQPLWMLGTLEDEKDARDHLARCFAVAGTLAERSRCRSELARRLAGSDPGAAEKAAHEALALAQESRDAVARTTSWQTRMRVSWALGPPERAWKDSRLALDAIEALRDQQGGSAGQPGLFSTWAEFYYWLSGRLLETGWLEPGFDVIERMRSRTLIDSMGLSRPGSGASPQLRAQRADLFLSIAQLQRRLLDPQLGQREHAKAKAELGLLEIQAEDLRARTLRADPAFAALRPPDFASVEQVRRALAPDQALLSYQVAPWHDLLGEPAGGSWLLVLTRAGTRVYRLRDRVELRPKVESFIGMFEQRNGSEAGGSVTLYRLLLGKALAELPAGIRRLVIVPDDTLHRLPFAALRPQESAKPLAVRYQISIVPSATLWLHWWNEQPGSAEVPAIVFADPPPTKPGAATERAAAFAAEISVGELPLARKEGRSVVRHLDGGSELLIGEKASEARLKQIEAGRFAVIHFATHSLTDDVNPDRSFVYLAPGNPKQDGLLQVREIVDLDFRGRIVVLSSCESASGEILRGEGVMGLARAFFQARAPTVVASLWPLRDDDGAALFDRFYAHIAEGKSVAAALQAAQLDRIEADAPADAWAGVVVLGDGDRVPLPGGRKRPLLPVSGVIVLLLSAASFALWLRRRKVS